MENQRLWVDGSLKAVDTQPFELAHHFRDEGVAADTYAWIDLTTESVDELKELQGVLDLHDLAVEDALATHERQKVSRFDHHSLMRVTNVVLDDDDRAQLAPLTAFITAHAVVTVRDPSFPVAEVIERLNLNENLASAGTGSEVPGCAVIPPCVDSVVPLLDDKRGVDVVDLTGRSFCKELDLQSNEWMHLLDLAAALKAERRSGEERQRLVGKNVALLFEKTSTRTRCAFEVAMADQGGRTTYLDPAGSQIGHKESPADTARVLGRWYDGIEYRGAGQDIVETLAAHAGVPVYNGLTDDWHPTQMLADQLTMIEHAGKPLAGVTCAFVGDVRNNVGNSTLISAAMMGMDIRMVAPKPHQTASEVLALAEDIARDTGARITVTDDVAEGVRGADFISTDVWVSLGEPMALWAERVALLRPYQVNAEMLTATGNSDVKFMHCLPAFHDRATSLGEELFQLTGMEGLEVTDEVFESGASIVFDQAENRMHTIKAILVATLAG